MIETRGKPTRAWSTRPYFAPRQKLTAHALNQLLEDQLQREALLARALHGSGVVFGYEVRADGGAGLAISCGLALDRHGRLLYREEGELFYERLAGDRPEREGAYTLVAHFAERRQEKPDCGPCESEAEWIEQGVVFTLSDDCGDADRRCPDIPDDACLRLFGYACLRTGGTTGPVPPSDDLQWACAEPGALCRTECGWCYDEAAGVPIARVSLRDLRGGEQGDACGPLWGFDGVENCEVRSYAPRAPLLLELIRGCHLDLPKVREFSWQDWTLANFDNEVDWQDFTARCDDSAGFRIRFSKAIDVRTLHPGSVFLTAIISDADNDYHDVRQIPLDPSEPIQFLDREGDHASWIQLNIYDEWKNNHVRGNYGSLFFRGGRIELVIRGQLLRDACGNMLDARHIGHSPPGADQRRSGGDFVAVFRVAPASTPRRKRLPAREQAGKAAPPDRTRNPEQGEE